MTDTGRTIYGGSGGSGLAPSMVSRMWVSAFSGTPETFARVDPTTPFDWELSEFEGGALDDNYQQHQLLTLGQGIYCVSLSMIVGTPSDPVVAGSYCYSEIAPYNAGDFSHVQRSISAFQGGDAKSTGTSLTFGAEDGYEYDLKCVSNLGGMLTGATVSLTIVKFS